MGDNDSAVGMGEKVKKGVFTYDSVDYTFDWSPFGQVKMNGCWLASFKILYAWASATGTGNGNMAKRTPDSVDNRVLTNCFRGNQADFDDRVANGLKTSERAASRAAVDLQGIDGKTATAMSMNEILKMLDQNGPLVMSVKLPDGNGGYIHHAVVLVGGQNPTVGNTYFKTINPFDEEAVRTGAATGTARPWMVGFDDWKGKMAPDPDITHALAWLGKSNDG